MKKMNFTTIKNAFSNIVKILINNYNNNKIQII